MLQTPEGDYCILQTPVTNGSHSVTHPSPDASFLVLGYGFAWRESYGQWRSQGLPGWATGGRVAHPKGQNEEGNEKKLRKSKKK